MRIESNTFAEACYEMNTIQELRETITQEPDTFEMLHWGLDEQEWRDQIQLAIDELESEE